MVLLIGNYAPDRQQSMQRFSAMMLRGLTAAGVPVELIAPQPWLGEFRGAGSFVAKWLAYLDKFLFFPRQLKRRLARGDVSLVHICDHSNAMYAAHCANLPVVTTCHDLLAVRGALGEATDCPASATGRMLQRWILRGLAQTKAIGCDSEATRDDAQRLVRPKTPPLRVITLGLNYPFRKLSADEVSGRLNRIAPLDKTKPFVLSVGSNLRRKNRDGVLRIFARTRDAWDGQLVFAGDALPRELQSLGEELGVASRVISIANPDDAVLEALYNRATALLYPSRFEGFGWPIAEAQACGCPVICGDRAPLPEVGGAAALIHALEDEDAFAADILRLNDAEERERWSAKSVRNAERFSSERMIAQYLDLYDSVGAEL